MSKISVIMTPKFCNIGDFVLHIFGPNGLSTGDALKTGTQRVGKFRPFNLVSRVHVSFGQRWPKDTWALGTGLSSVPLDYTGSPRNRTAFYINVEHYVQRHRWEILYPTSYNLKSGEPY